MSFSRLTAGLTERLEVIVRFLAVLELFKQGVVDLEQAASFGELQVTWLASTERPGRRLRLGDWSRSTRGRDGGTWHPKSSGPSRRSSWWPTSRSSPDLLAQLLEMSAGPDRGAAAPSLAAAYADEDRGFELVRVAGGYRFQSHPDLAPYVERFVLEGQTARLSAAALETLAIVAYKQPVSRAQVAAIRGVNADGVIRTLQTRGFIAEVGRDPGPGQAVAVRHDRRSCSSGWAWTGSSSCRRWPSSCPGRR